MLTLKQGLKISAIIDKLNLKITDPKASQEEVGADLMMQVITRAHLAEQEIYDLVADVKGISVQEAENVDLVEFITGLVKDPAVGSFFKSAVK
jgi:hypothetical protein